MSFNTCVKFVMTPTRENKWMSRRKRCKIPSLAIRLWCTINVYVNCVFYRRCASMSCVYSIDLKIRKKKKKKKGRQDYRLTFLKWNLRYDIKRTKDSFYYYRGDLFVYNSLTNVKDRDVFSLLLINLLNG